MGKLKDPEGGTIWSLATFPSLQQQIYLIMKPHLCWLGCLLEQSQRCRLFPVFGPVPVEVFES